MKESTRLFNCPHCKEQCSVSRKLLGSGVICPHCGNTFNALANSRRSSQQLPPTFNAPTKLNWVSGLGALWIMAALVRVIWSSQSAHESQPEAKLPTSLISTNNSATTESAKPTKEEIEALATEVENANNQIVQKTRLANELKQKVTFYWQRYHEHAGDAANIQNWFERRKAEDNAAEEEALYKKFFAEYQNANEELTSLNSRLRELQSSLLQSRNGTLAEKQIRESDKKEIDNYNLILEAKRALESSKGTAGSTWNPNSDGYTWNSASESARRDLAKRLAAQSKTGASAQYFYDSLNAAYNTSDDKILRQPIRLSAQFTEESKNLSNYTTP